MTRLRTLEDLDVTGERVLLRANLNVPLRDEPDGTRQVAGGGETVQALRDYGLERRISHLSTGGGATLELLQGVSLPGVRALEEESSAAGVRQQ